jgi:superfamily II DNA or RNA helicase
MKLTEFLKMHGSKMGYLEQSFLKNIFYVDYGESGLNLITPEVDLDRNDGSDRKWRLDFEIKTKSNKFAIECDGYNYHAPGRVSRERFNELEIKRNETLRQGYQLISFSKDQVIDNPDECIYELRRSVNSDRELFDLFLNRSKGQIKPHDAQQKALDALIKARNGGLDKGLVVLATGLGKTYLSAFDAVESKAKTILFIVHVDFILKQARNSFEKVMPGRIKEMGFYTGKVKETEGKKIIFTTIQTINKEKNLSLFKPTFFDYIVIDESHHTAAESYKKIINYFSPKFLLGLTATPDRMDKKDILEFYGNNLLFEMNQAEAIKQGYLVSLNYKGFLDNVDYSGIHYNGFRYDVNDLNKALMIEKRDAAIIKKFKELALNKKTIGFCVSIEHADWMANSFRKAGFDAVSIHSKINNENTDGAYQDATELINAFDKSNHQIAFVVDMLNEGIDIPDVECLLMLRPTESSTVLTQQIGRGLRIATGKKEILILDFIGNYRSAPQIIKGLGLGGSFPGEFKTRPEKDVYFYENEGRQVEFQAEVVDIFKYILSKSSSEVREGSLTSEWKDYGEYIKSITAEGSNLYWSVGKKNNDIGIQLWALDFIFKNHKKYISNEDLSKAISLKSKNKFPDATLEGIRGLFFSKLIGLLISTYPIKFSPAYLAISRQIKSGGDGFKNLISNQLEKFYFFNDIASLTNRHAHKRSVDQVFHVYPIFFIYQLLIRLHQRGDEPSLSKFEIDNFVTPCRNHAEVTDCLNKITSYRQYSEKYELEKFLNIQSRMDTRFYKVLAYSKYLSFSPEKIRLYKDGLNDLEVKVSQFNELISSEKLIRFEKNNRDGYRNLLYSNLDLISYHKSINFL